MPSRGRPKKDPNAPKATYHLSSLERARRATQQKIRRNLKAADDAAKKVKKHRQNAKQIKNNAK